MGQYLKCNNMAQIKIHKGGYYAASRGKKEEVTCEKVSMNVVQEMLKVQMDTILACFNQVVSNLSQKVDGIMCDVHDLKTNLNFIGTDFEEKVKNISDNVTLVKKEISNTNLLNHDDRTAVKYNGEKLVDLEDSSRRNNMRVDGMIESERENWAVTEEKVKSLFREQLNISEDIEIHRDIELGVGIKTNHERSSYDVIYINKRLKYKGQLRNLKGQAYISMMIIRTRP